MKESEFFATLEEITVSDKGTIGKDDVLKEIVGWDSVAVVQFIAEMDKQLDVVVPPESLAEAKTAGDLLRLVEDKIDRAD